MTTSEPETPHVNFSFAYLLSCLSVLVCSIEMFILFFNVSVSFQTSPYTLHIITMMFLVQGRVWEAQNLNLWSFLDWMYNDLWHNSLSISLCHFFSFNIWRNTFYIKNSKTFFVICILLFYISFYVKTYGLVFFIFSDFIVRFNNLNFYGFLVSWYAQKNLSLAEKEKESSEPFPSLFKYLMPLKFILMNGVT